FGQSAFRIIRKLGHQVFADNEAENRIAEKFELLIISGGVIVRTPLVDPRLVGEGPPQEVAVLEMMAEKSLQRISRPAHEHVSYCFAGGGAAPPAALFLAISAFLPWAICFTWSVALGVLMALSNAAVASSSLPAS